MKIVKAEEMARIERLAYAAGASEEAFMLQAGTGSAELIQQTIARLHLRPKITLLCGSGNNAGDAYVAGKILLEGGFHVHALACAPFEKFSPLCKSQSLAFVSAGGRIEYIQEAGGISFGDSELLVDGLLGTGFHGEVKGLYREAIEKANASKLPIVSIDIPSGINGSTGEIGGAAIEAVETLFLGLPKTGCFLGQAWNYVGQIHTYNFGLEDKYIAEGKEDFVLIDDQMVSAIFPPLIRTRHKYQVGYVVGLGGSKGMPGAPIMASYSALKSGAGIVRLLHPEGMDTDLAFAPYEVIRQGYQDAASVLKEMERAAALFVGPGMGGSSEAIELLKKVIPEIKKPCVIDADALTILAELEIPLPPETIMTPHHGEMKRLLHKTEELSFTDLLELSRAYAARKNITLVLKGAPTFIIHRNLKPFVCSRGDPGMATAGSGDVLTGVIAGLVAQVRDPLKAAILGVQLHAIAGEYAARKLTSYCMTATDITKALPQVFAHYGKHYK